MMMMCTGSLVCLLIKPLCFPLQQQEEGMGGRLQVIAHSTGGCKNKGITCSESDITKPLMGLAGLKRERVSKSCHKILCLFSKDLNSCA